MEGGQFDQMVKECMVSDDDYKLQENIPQMSFTNFPITEEENCDVIIK